ncbi:DUF1398 domain-containing protein [Serratia marcescens]|uniref:hypothetical protein n=1 Tax=Serratia marcescens TaxID=615 RepID=UPI001C95DF5B|nr:hypothetical protein [Serratia marcescens]MBY4850249.1 hypothetical protein [Serratia marcescens]MCH9868361.1 hypothetical protein [Serratia marcescens]UIM56021.1 hypothetical protein LXH15_02505 [Serratia marcescens]
MEKMQGPLILNGGVEWKLNDGGFPFFSDVLFRAGVLSNVWSLPACQSLYVTRQGIVKIPGASLMVPQELPQLDDKKLYQAICRAREEYDKHFRSFLFELCAAGVVNYTVDCVARTVTFYGEEAARMGPYREKTLKPGRKAGINY